ncbi:MAG: hypothetical protein ACYCTE_10250 [Acidimicrobiales bacterium]
MTARGDDEVVAALTADADGRPGSPVALRGRKDCSGVEDYSGQAARTSASTSSGTGPKSAPVAAKNSSTARSWEERVSVGRDP